MKKSISNSGIYFPDFFVDLITRIIWIQYTPLQGLSFSTVLRTDAGVEKFSLKNYAWTTSDFIFNSLCYRYLQKYFLNCIQTMNPPDFTSIHLQAEIAHLLNSVWNRPKKVASKRTFEVLSKISQDLIWL